MPDLDRIELKIDRVLETQATQAVTLARNTTTLEEHVRRTDILESRLEPLTAAHQRWVGAGKAFAAVGAAIGTVAGLAAVAEFVLHVVGHFR